jgi:hypothetical protein
MLVRVGPDVISTRKDPRMLVPDGLGILPSRRASRMLARGLHILSARRDPQARDDLYILSSRTDPRRLARGLHILAPRRSPR